MNTTKSELESGEVVTIQVDAAIADVGSHELLSDLASIFAEDALTLVDELETAVTTKRSEIAQRTAHSLKSMTAVFRAEPTTSLARKAELLCTMNGWEELATVILLLRQAIIQTVDALRQEGLLR